MSRRQKVGVVIALILLVLSIGVTVCCGRHLYQTYASGAYTYRRIAEQVLSKEEEGSQLADQAGDTGSGGVGRILVPRLSVDFAALTAINSDAVAWLYCPDTIISYPVMAAADYTYYLYHLADGTYNINGSLFLDYHNRFDFSDQLTVIYGHNMKSGKMFGTLDEYKMQSYFDQHPYLYLYTESKNYRITLMYGAAISAEEWSSNGYMQEENLEALVDYAKEHTTFLSGISWDDQEDDPSVVVLSTCSYEDEGIRYFVVGLLEEGT